MPTDVNLSYAYTGAHETLVLPYNIVGQIHFRLIGGSGDGASGVHGGDGGLLDGYLNFDPETYGGATLYIYVGQSGRGTAGGWNGGGDGNDTDNTFTAAGGGGASDIRLNSTALSARKVVAAGGGGSTADNPGGTGANWNRFVFSGGPNGQAGVSWNNGGWGDGGTQSAGGKGGTGGGDSPADGTSGGLGFGGNGGQVHLDSYSNGAGGGSGYYGGGGGGGYSTGHRGGSGGGGSNYAGFLDVVNTNHANTFWDSGQESNVMSYDGSITIQYTTADPQVSIIDMGGIGGLLFAAPVTHVPSVPLLGQSVVNLAGFKKSTDAAPLVGTGKLIIPTAPSVIIAGAPLKALGELSLDGFTELFEGLGLSAFGGLTLQETLAHLDLAALTEMDVATSTEPFGAIDMVNEAVLDVDGKGEVESGFAVSVAAEMLDLPNLTTEDELRMAVAGAVELSAGLSRSGGIQTLTEAVLGLTGTLTTIGAVPIFVTTSWLTIPAPVRHFGPTDISVVSQLQVTGNVDEIAAYLFNAYGALDLPHVEISNVSVLQALAQMIIDDTPSIILDPPYLTITDDHNTVQFFVTSWPNRGDVRQVVSRND